MAQDKRHAVTEIATAAVAAKRFVTIDGAHATSSEQVIGVSETAAAVGRGFSAITHFSAEVESAGAIAVGARVGPSNDGTGRAVSGGCAGVAVSAATGAGQLVEVVLFGVQPGPRWAPSGAGHALVLPGGGVAVQTTTWVATAFSATGLVPGMANNGYMGFQARSIAGTVNLLLRDATSGAGDQLHQINGVSVTGGPLGNGVYPLIGPNAARLLTTGLHVTWSGGGTGVVDALTAP